MSVSLKLTAIGNSTGVILPREVLARLGLSKGDKVFLSETRDGYAITPYDKIFAEQMEAGEEFMNEYRDVMRALAK